MPRQSSSPLRIHHSPFNEAQQAFIDFLWDMERCRGKEKPAKPQIRAAWAKCRRMGPEVSAQDIGKYYANRAAAAAGRPRATTKTPEQLELLQESFNDDPFPTTLETINLVHSTGLTGKQVNAWFQYERKKVDRAGGDLRPGINPENNAAVSARLWREYEQDHDAFMKKYFPKNISSEEEIGEQLRLRRDLGYWC